MNQDSPIASTGSRPIGQPAAPASRGSRLKPRPSFWSRYARTILGAAILLLGIHDILGPHGFLAMRRTQREMNQLRSDVDRLNKENNQLADDATALKSDPQAIERIAREDMGLARPGEMIFKLPPPAPVQQQSQKDNSH
jgi:cell division protein FtsB